MRGKSHLILGAITGAATAAFATPQFSNLIVPSMAIIGGSVLGSLLPDIDLPNSTMGKKIKPIAKIINKLFGHRTITHAPLWLVPLFFLYVNLTKLGQFETLRSFILGYMSGFVSHLFADMLTRGGIPLFYPFRRRRFHLTNIQSGTHDFFLSGIVVCVYIGFWISLRARLGWQFSI